MLRLGFGCALAVFLAIAPVHANLGWETYRDSIYDCQLQYPGSMFTRDELDVAQDAQRFSGPNQFTYFRVMGFNNPTELSATEIKAKYYAASVPGEVVYERTKAGFLVLSGYRNGSIFYMKVSLSPIRRVACVLEIVYPRASKEAFDSIVTRMSRSFMAP